MCVQVTTNLLFFTGNLLLLACVADSLNYQMYGLSAQWLSKACSDILQFCMDVSISDWLVSYALFCDRINSWKIDQLTITQH